MEDLQTIPSQETITSHSSSSSGSNGLEVHEEEIDSTCSTPYVSAPSSPGRSVLTHGSVSGYFFSAPTSPMHYVLSSSCTSLASAATSSDVMSSSEFEFSSRFVTLTSGGGGTGGGIGEEERGSVLMSMTSADELFCNGQIRPMMLSTHLQRPQVLSPLLDLDIEDGNENDDEQEDGNMDKNSNSFEFMRGRGMRMRNRSVHRRARSASPLRNEMFPWRKQQEQELDEVTADQHGKQAEAEAETETPSVSASSSRSSSTGSSRNSKRWEFLKDFLRSKSEGRNNIKEKFWFTDKKPKSSPFELKVKQPRANELPEKKSASIMKPSNGMSKRRIPPSAHELHYTAKRAQAEEMKRRTYLPYRQGLFGCLGFSSKGYGAMNVFAKSLNPVSSR